MKKDLQAAIRRAKQAGWTVTPTGSGHWRFRKEGCGDVVTSSSPSDPRTLANLTARLRRAERSSHVPG